MTLHSEVEELLGAYALDALVDDERAAVEEHLAACGRCRAEVAEHQQTASILATVGAPAPAGVWDRIATEIEGRDALVAPLEFHRRRQTARWASHGLAVAAAVAVVMAMALGTLVVRQNDRLDGLNRRERLRGQLAAALVDPSARRVQLVSDDQHNSAGAVIAATGQGYLVTNGLTDLPNGKTYQLWGIAAGTPRSLGVLGDDPDDVIPFRLLSDTEVLAITVEKAVPGGVRGPDHRARRPRLPPRLRYLGSSRFSEAICRLSPQCGSRNQGARASRE